MSGPNKNPVHLMPRALQSLHDGNFTSRQIADHIGLPQSWVTSALSQMAKQGLVRRAEKLKAGEGTCRKRDGSIRKRQGQRPYRWVLV